MATPSPRYTDNQEARQQQAVAQRPGGIGRGPGAHMMGGRTIEKAKDVRGALRRLLAYLGPYKLALLAVFVLVIASSGLGLAGPYLLGQAIDRFITPGDSGGLLRIVLAMFGVYIGGWAAQAGQGIIMSRVSQRALFRLRRDLFEHLQTLSLSFFDRNPHGQLMSRLTNDIDAINRVVSQNVTQLFSGALTLVGILVSMFSLNALLALGSLLALPLMLLVTYAVGKRTRGGFRDYQMSLGDLNATMEETLSGQRVVQAFGQEAVAVAAFDKANEATARFGIHAQSYSLLVPPLMGILSNLNIAIVAGLGGWLTLRGMATVGTIATFVSYSRRFADPLRQLADLYNSIQSALAGAERIFQVIDEQPELADEPGAPELADIKGEVVFDHVDFGYVPGVPVLKDVCLRAEPGQTIALVGPTGAGKTTIVNLLSRFYDLQRGHIYIDGQDIHDVQKDSLRRQLGVVLQDTFLFADTVMENIRYGRLDATDAEVIEAAKLSNADNFVKRLPEGYDSVLSERASNLSQGQRQLLTIARAILANPRILVLDEATSSVDTRTEIHIQQALLELMKGRTAFVIAHRLSTIRGADEVLVINHGEIIERGSHEALLAQKGFYYNLYMSQFKGKAHEGYIATEDMVPSYDAAPTFFSGPGMGKGHPQGGLSPDPARLREMMAEGRLPEHVQRTLREGNLLAHARRVVEGSAPADGDPRDDSK